VLATLLLWVVHAGEASAQDQSLGRIEFPTSGAAVAQGPFVRGVLLLHSFEYERAAEAFREAQRRDPGLALAYWGEAMTYNHPIWNEQDRDAARAALARLAPTADGRRARAPTARERGYLEAVEILYGDGPKELRDTLYGEAMERLAHQFPEDDEAKAFHALALLGLSRGERHVATYMRAAALALEVFARNPLHPGAAHYIIHSFDDPVHAPLGLPAARAYSRIAPDAPHAQHMTTHIFVALGMWDEVVSQNTIAAGARPWRPGHYTAWLGYGYLQQGRQREALAHLEEVYRNLPERASRGQRGYLASMRADYVMNTRQWNSPVLAWRLDLSDTWGGARAQDAFARAVAALERGARPEAERALTDMAARGNETATRIMAAELRALIALQARDADQAVTILREAAAAEDSMPSEFGPPVVVKPPRELLGEILLDLDRPAEAQAEFERALRLAPKRALALLGLGRAAALAGDEATALRAYTALQQMWHSADRDLAALAEVVRFLETHQASGGR
jgi:tetratricopeptide (TPR) repeat protein